MNTGGPAFPVPVSDATDGRTHDGGMTLLDWMAGQALVGSLASQSKESHWAFATVEYETADNMATKGIAALCYDLAEAMLAEKARREAVVKESQTTDHSGDANKMACKQSHYMSSANYASALVAEKARREATGKDGLQVEDHFRGVTKMVWKQSQNMRSAVVCETQFSKTNADDENVEAYGGYLVAESVPLEAMDLIIRAPKLERQNAQLWSLLRQAELAIAFANREPNVIRMLGDDYTEVLQLVRAALKEAKP